MALNVHYICLSLKEVMSNIYGKNLDSLILFGSHARHEAKELSDIDLLAVLKSEINPYQEIDKTDEVIARYSLENDVVISCQFISAQNFHQQDTPFLANVKREGIIL